MDKQTVVQSLRNMKDGLGKLESDFLMKPGAKKYLQSIEGITDLATESLSLASSGKFVASTEPLQKAQQKLANTLAVLPR